jgi:hypothetical protein
MRRLLFFLSLLVWVQSDAQETFSVHVNPTLMPGIPTLHSGSFARYNNLWIFAGGRINGLHGFFGPLAFPLSEANNAIWVYDPVNFQVWNVSLLSLPDSIREPIASSNMQFTQNDSMLYMVGGYGWKNDTSGFVTFPTLTAIHLPGIIDAAQNSGNPATHIRSLRDARLAVCGGEMEKIDSVYYLVFGHKFDGLYNRISSGGGFTQRYTHQIRSFTISDDGNHLSMGNYQSLTDSLNFRRRDYNLVPQIFPGGQYGLTAFAGVFQQGIDQPYHTSTNITPGNAQHIPGFSQNLSQYTCATLPVYDQNATNMHTIFFGGMSKYFPDSLTGTLMMDSLIPFVKTISRVSRDAGGNMSEFALPEVLPELMGSNARFVPAPGVPLINEKIIDLNALSGNTLVGHIINGISSPEANISSTDPSASWATQQILEVYIDKTVTGHALQVKEPWSFNVSPNPSEDGRVNIRFSGHEKTALTVEIFDNLGRKLNRQSTVTLNKSGIKNLEWNLSDMQAGLYYIRVTGNAFTSTERLLLRK